MLTHREVFPGNTAEVDTLKTSLLKVVNTFPIKRVIAVADRGLLSLESLGELQQIVLPLGQPLEFILAVPGRRYKDFQTLLAPFNEHVQSVTSVDPDTEEAEVFGEVEWEGLRLVVAHDPERAAEQTTKRDAKIAQLEARAEQWADKLDSQDEGKKSRGRKLTDGGAQARFYREVCEERLGLIMKVNFNSELFNYDIDEEALARARAMDGKLLLVTNTKDMDVVDVVTRYKSLADIERGFKLLKSDIEIGPVYHRLPDRIRAHAYICFIALVLARVMRARLRANPVPDVVSSERALWLLRQIQTHKVHFEGQDPVVGISTIGTEQATILRSLEVKKPSISIPYVNL